MQTYPYTLADQNCDHKNNMLYLMKSNMAYFSLDAYNVGGGMNTKHTVKNPEKDLKFYGFCNMLKAKNTGQAVATSFFHNMVRNFSIQ